MKKAANRTAVLSRADTRFEEAVKDSSFNSHDPGRRPDFIYQANDVGDVIDAVQLGRSQNLKISIVSGGHSWSQNHLRDGGLMLDLSSLNDMHIDPVNRTAIVGPGVHGGDFDAELGKHGLFFPVAHAYTVGMGGFLLQGGFGWFGRVLGMSCESVTAVDVVLADGTLVHASEAENSDLLWAVRGAGAGFFGVVVRFYLKLYDRPKYVGVKIQVFRLKHLEALLTWAYGMREHISPKVECQVVFNRKAIGLSTHGLELNACVMADSRREAKELVAFITRGPLRKRASLTFPMFGMALGKLMKLAEKALMWPNRRWFTDGSWLNGPVEPTLPAIRKIAESQPAAPSHALWQIWNPAARRRPDMAYSLEGEVYFALYGACKQGTNTPDEENWSTQGARSLEQFSVGIQVGDENLARRPAPFLMPENFAKLQEMRSKYDPEGRFYNYAHMC